MDDRRLPNSRLEMDVKLTPINPPRSFNVGVNEVIQLTDCAHIELAPNEQVTFMTESGAEYDVVRKPWGFYATPSLNSRLRKFDLRAVLVKSPGPKFFILLVERGKETEFQRYLHRESLTVVCWLDNDAELQALERKLNGTRDET